MRGIDRVDDATFGERVERAGGLVVVDFTAEWCGPCRVLAPVLEQLAEEYGPRLRIVSLDVDANPVTTARFGVRGMPTIVFFRDGVEVGRSVGAVPKPVLRARIDGLVPSAKC